MAISSDTKWIVGTGLLLAGAIGGAVVYLTTTQTNMENRLTTALGAAETRLSEDLNKVETRLGEQIAKLETGLRTVEGETAILAGVETRLTEKIETTAKQLSENIQGAETRLTAQITNVRTRLREVEGETAKLAGMVESSATPTQWIWPASKGTLAEVMHGMQESTLEGGKVQTVANPEAMDFLKESGVKVDFFMTPVPVIHPYTKGPFGKAYIEALEKHLAALKAGQPTDDDARDTTESE